MTLFFHSISGPWSTLIQLQAGYRQHSSTLPWWTTQHRPISWWICLPTPSRRFSILPMLRQHFSRFNKFAKLNPPSAWTKTALLLYWTCYFSRKPIQMCKIIDGFPANADILEKVFAAASLYYNFTGDQSCNQIEYDNDSSSSLGLSGWGWQVHAIYKTER